jgi:transposase-like protein
MSVLDLNAALYKWWVAPGTLKTEAGSCTIIHVFPAQGGSYEPARCILPCPTCPIAGQVGQGNVIGHGRTRRPYRCTICRKTFSPRTDTLFNRRHTAMRLMAQIITLVSYGCPIPAIEATFGVQARTVREWAAAAGRQSAAVQQHVVQQSQELGHVQADELRVRVAGGVVWMAMAMVVTSRLWLGAAVGMRRDRALLDRLAAIVARCALGQRLLLVVDGFSAYVEAFKRACAMYQSHPHGGRRTCIPGPVAAIIA